MVCLRCIKSKQRSRRYINNLEQKPFIAFSVLLMLESEKSLRIMCISEIAEQVLLLNSSQCVLCNCSLTRHSGGQKDFLLHLKFLSSVAHCGLLSQWTLNISKLENTCLKDFLFYMITKILFSPSTFHLVSSELMSLATF